MTKRQKNQGGFTGNYKIVHWALFLIVIFNGILIWSFERDRRPKIVRETVTVVTNIVHTVTNFVSASGVPLGTNGVGSAVGIKPNDPAFEIEIPYRYMLVAGRRLIELGGRYFSEGSPTSYGVIARIFPERVALDNGYFLKCRGFDERWSYDDHPNRSKEWEREQQQRSNRLEENTTVFVPQLPDLYKPYRREVYCE